MYTVHNIAPGQWVVTNMFGVVLYAQDDINDVVIFTESRYAYAVCTALNNAINAGRSDKAAEIRKALEI